MEDYEINGERPYTRVYAAVDLDAVEENVKAMRAVLSENTGIMGVVKADGYGHGAVPVAKVMDPYVRMYGVADIEEAVNLKRHNIRRPVLVLGMTHSRHNSRLVNLEIRSSVFERGQAKELSRTAVSLGKKAFIHLAVDTGMNRIGMKPVRESACLAAEISRMPGICVEGIFTHFARADEKDRTQTQNQMDAYMGFMKMLEDEGVRIPVKHISNSAGIVDFRQADQDMVRAGISMYGLYPSDDVGRDRVILKRAMELKSCITCIRDIGPGEPVSYGGTFTSSGPMTVATIPVGYGDGYPRSLSGKGRVLIRGRSAPILGRVCMDQMMVDVTDIPHVSPDDAVTLMGRDGAEEITAEELARLGGGFHYEILCNVGKRVPRVYLRGGKIVGTKDYFADPYQDFMDI